MCEKFGIEIDASSAGALQVVITFSQIFLSVSTQLLSIMFMHTAMCPKKSSTFIVVQRH